MDSIQKSPFPESPSLASFLSLHFPGNTLPREFSSQEIPFLGSSLPRKYPS